MSGSETGLFAGSPPSLPHDIVVMLRGLKNELLRIDGVVSVVLFGSYSKGTYTSDSDIDIAVFIRNNAADRICSIYRQAVRRTTNYRHDIQILIFSEDTLDAPVGIVEEIVAYGKDITNL